MIEVLIVLAVTGALFLSAVFLINGKQQVTAYNQSIRNVETELQQVVNEVGSGFYANGGNITCINSGGKPRLGNNGSDTQGTNKDCIFLGKTLQFAVKDTDPETYHVFTVVGLRGNSVNPSLDLASAQARLIGQATNEVGSAVPNAYDTKKLLYGLTVSKMYYDNDPGKKIGAVAITSSLGTLGEADGSQQVNVVAIPGTQLRLTAPEAVSQVNSQLGSGVVNPTGGVQICFDSGGTKQSGLITLGGEGRQGNVELRIFSNLGCTS